MGGSSFIIPQKAAQPQLAARTLAADGADRAYGELVPLKEADTRDCITTAVLPAESWTALELEVGGSW